MRAHARHGNETRVTSWLSPARLSNVRRRASISAGFLRCRFSPTPGSTVVFRDKHASCTRPCAPRRRSVPRIYRLTAANCERARISSRLELRACARARDSIEHKLPIFVTREKKKRHPRKRAHGVAAGQPETFPIKVLAIRNDRRDTTRRSARSH